MGSGSGAAAQWPRGVVSRLVRWSLRRRRARTITKGEKPASQQRAVEVTTSAVEVTTGAGAKSERPKCDEGHPNCG
eukprot:scaffold64646_cov63-Phaeocystis_antarctica.AAC.2